MKTLILSLFLLSASITAVEAKPVKPVAKSTAKFTGYLIDNMCAPAVVQDPSMTQEKAEAHSKECLVEEVCKQSGYGIVTRDGRFLKFDKRGSLRATKIAERTQKEDHIGIVVRGKMSGDNLIVSSIAER